ncbi:MAG: type II/IV secretion system protein [Pirellulaceae bacterium]|nr:type II/IV secretion system protein [Pirellulaceae bacterium]
MPGTSRVTTTSAPNLATQLGKLNAAQNAYASQFVSELLAAACQQGASDVHLHPTASGLEVRWRIDGVLQSVGIFPPGEAADVVSRLKVLAGLLTYRTDVPQEGRLAESAGGVGFQPAQKIEMRVSTFPTLYGERAVVRIFAAEGRYLYPEELELPEEVHAGLLRKLEETSGALLITGPAGSGKTTTAYAALRHLARKVAGSKSLVSLEDPIEVALPGVAQSQVNAAAGFDLAAGLRSLMRQDPEVILVGEIRDRPAAETAFQAALTGHLVLTTFHASNCTSALSRLADMGIEPYLLRSGVRGVLSQRLVRKLCACARPIEREEQKLGLSVASGRIAGKCAACASTGYSGRLVLAELLPTLEGELAAAVLARRDSQALFSTAVSAGLVPLLTRACQAVEAGQTDPAEIRRVLGFETH